MININQVRCPQCSKLSLKETENIEPTVEDYLGQREVGSMIFTSPQDNIRNRIQCKQCNYVKEYLIANPNQNQLNG